MGPWTLTAFATNATLGSGIFGLPASLAALTGPYSILVIVACGLLVALVALCFAEMSSRFDRTGGPQLYTSLAFGPAAGFATGWLCWLSRVASCAAIANLLIDYGVVLYPAANHPAVRTVLISTLTLVYTWINLRGIRPTAAVNSAFAVCKVLPLLALATIGVSAVTSRGVSFGPPPPAADLANAVLLAMFAYSGFEAPTMLAGEVRDARRSVPFALLLSLAVVTLIYGLIQLTCVGLVPPLALSQRPLVDAATTLMGSWAAPAVGAAAIIASVGVFGATMTSATRVLFAMAEQEQLPQPVAYVHSRYHTPAAAILITAGTVLVLALSGSFIYLVKLSLVGRLSVYAATCAVLPLFRRRKEIPATAFQVPAGSTIAYGCLLLLVLCLARSSTPELFEVALALAAGLAIYGLTQFSNRSPEQSPELRLHPTHKVRIGRLRGPKQPIAVRSVDH